VLLGLHWLSDVVGGLALGWAWFALAAVVFGGRLLIPTAAADVAAGRAHASQPSARLEAESLHGGLSTEPRGVSQPRETI
jgi:hypothetical protein